MKTAPFRTSLMLAGLMLTSAFAVTATAAPRNVTDPQAPRALPDTGPVQVQWTDPAQFSEIRQSRNRWEAERGNWVQALAEYLQKQALKQLPPGQRLAVTLTDIKRAGDYEPWHGPNTNDVRIIRDIYPPRITLQFTLTGSDGQVLDQGQRKLIDTAFMFGDTRLSDSDPLRYEKRLLDDWLRRELRQDRTGGGAG